MHKPTTHTSNEIHIWPTPSSPTETHVVYDGYYEPGNGTSYALAALRLTPGEWPGTKGMVLPALVSWENSGAYVFELGGSDVLHADYLRQKLGGSICDASAIVRWLEGFPGAEFTPVVTCSCGRNGHDA